jgi:hypothetical protein
MEEGSELPSNEDEPELAHDAIRRVSVNPIMDLEILIETSFA